MPLAGHDTVVKASAPVKAAEATTKEVRPKWWRASGRHLMLTAGKPFRALLRVAHARCDPVRLEVVSAEVHCAWCVDLQRGAAPEADFPSPRDIPTHPPPIPSKSCLLLLLGRLKTCPSYLFSTRSVGTPATPKDCVPLNGKRHTKTALKPKSARRVCHLTLGRVPCLSPPSPFLTVLTHVFNSL